MTDKGGYDSPEVPQRGEAVLPEPLANAEKILEATLEDVPTPEALAKWLQDRGLETKDWGQGDTKDVGKFWKEIKLQEAGAEVWRKADGTLQPVRVTHVLRAKVTSPESYERQIFLFNTWQQYGDGRTRTRNGLLSEKLSLDEMPLEEHLHEVCERAVTEEEMQRVVESQCKIGPGRPAPEYDPDYVCPLKVVDEHFVDHIIEIETSKSYPGLLTMYHLYTVDIICSGLPLVDLNTLEFDHPDKNGARSLKYIHAWVWLEWSKIQRYLFEGSRIREKKVKGSFQDEKQLATWLRQFSLELDVWGKDSYKSVSQLFQEIETEETELELWGRTDGVPLLVRVAHVLQLEVHTTDARMDGKFLLNTWDQLPNGKASTKNRLLSQKLSLRSKPFDEEKFQEAAKEAIMEQLPYLVDMHFQVNPDKLPVLEDYKLSDDNDSACSRGPQALPDYKLKVLEAKFKEHRHEVEESPGYKGLWTMYHLYAMEVECEGLPGADFASLDFSKKGRKNNKGDFKCAHGMSWVTWPQVLDILHNRTGTLERSKGHSVTSWELQRRKFDEGFAQFAGLTGAMQRLCEKVPSNDPDAIEAARHANELHKIINGLKTGYDEVKVWHAATIAGRAEMLPPSMISNMAESTIATKEFLASAHWQRVQAAEQALIERGLSSSLDRPLTVHSLDRLGAAPQPGTGRPTTAESTTTR